MFIFMIGIKGRILFNFMQWLEANAQTLKFKGVYHRQAVSRTVYLGKQWILTHIKSLLVTSFKEQILDLFFQKVKIPSSEKARRIRTFFLKRSILISFHNIVPGFLPVPTMYHWRYCGTFQEPCGNRMWMRPKKPPAVCSVKNKEFQDSCYNMQNLLWFLFFRHKAAVLQCHLIRSDLFSSAGIQPYRTQTAWRKGFNEYSLCGSAQCQDREVSNE